eukprot:2863004-Amphidinium_carterae.1
MITLHNEGTKAEKEERMLPYQELLKGCHALGEHKQGGKNNMKIVMLVSMSQHQDISMASSRSREATLMR